MRPVQYRSARSAARSRTSLSRRPARGRCRGGPARGRRRCGGRLRLLRGCELGSLVISLANPNLNSGAAAGDTYSTIEGIIGGRGNDTICGDARRNYLYGRSGCDTIDGELGNDSLSGQVGADSFRFTTALSKTNVDMINDFTHGEDKILPSQAIFAGTGATLDANEFGATSLSTLISYSQGTGQLSYDAGGSGSGPAPVLFAKVTAGTVLGISDFLMIA